MTDRRQYIQIDTFTSRIENSLPCSVVQGSKLSATSYTLYTNKITLLYTLMETDHYEQITGLKTTDDIDIDHIIINYVDDSTNIISSDNKDKLQRYIDPYYILLTNYYNINYLKINSDKSTLLVTTRPCNTHISKDMKLTAGDYTIEQSDRIKILGLYFTNGLDNGPNVSKVIQKVNFRINILSKIIKLTNTETS